MQSDVTANADAMRVVRACKTCKERESCPVQSSHRHNQGAVAASAVEASKATCITLQLAAQLNFICGILHQRTGFDCVMNRLLPHYEGKYTVR